MSEYLLVIYYVRRTNCRVLDTEGPTMETSVSFTGTIKWTPVKETVTFVGKPTSTGVIHGKGQGLVMAGESEVATFTGEGFGRISPSGTAKWRGAQFCRTSANGKLAFLNNVVGVFETEVDAEGEYNGEGLGMEVAPSVLF